MVMDESKGQFFKRYVDDQGRTYFFDSCMRGGHSYERF